MTSAKMTVYTRIIASGDSSAHSAPRMALLYLAWNSRLTLPSTKPRYDHSPRSIWGAIMALCAR
jgi:hypothetical protein